jgi:electron transport complex protein RnfG
MSEEHTTDAPAPPEVSSLRLVLTLGIAGMLAGLLLVVVDGLTAPAIAAYKKKLQEEAATEVLGGATRLEKLALVDGQLQLLGAAEAAPLGAEVAFRGFDEADQLVGYALPGGKFGYADVIELMVGYAPTTDTVLGMKVLGNKETPGLGDGIIKNEAYTGQFPGRSLPLVPTKGTASGPGDVDTITGATISSKAVVLGINDAIERFRPAIEALEGAER